MVPGPFRSLPGGDFEHTALVIQNAPKRSVFLIQTVSRGLGGANAALSPLPPHRMSILKQRSWSCGTLQNRLFLFGKRPSRSSCGAMPVSWVARRSNLMPRSCSSIMVSHPWFWLCKRASLSLSRAM